MESLYNTITEQVPRSWERFTVLTPEVAVGDVTTNVERIRDLYETAASENSLVAVAPELSITGYSLGDGFLFDNVTKKTIEGLTALAEATNNQPTTLIVGAPIMFENALYNCAVVMTDGEIIGIVPKSHLPNYGEFYEKRWFREGKDIRDENVTINGKEVPFGVDLLFKTKDSTFGVEVCEDIWVADPPSRKLAEAGAEVILNLSASTEIVGKAKDRRSLVTQTAARLLCGYVYASADPTESTSDVIMSGHGIISEFDNIMAERPPLVDDQRVLSADLDLRRIRYDRQQNGSWEPQGSKEFRKINCSARVVELTESKRFVDPHPFIPSDKAERSEVTNEILNLQARGLKKRLEAVGSNNEYPRIVIGLSGGLDSTLALLVAARACDMLGIDRSHIITLTMPAHASSARTQDNASLLGEALGTTHEVIPIQELVNTQLTLLHHNGISQDTTFENVQARTRTALLFNKANQRGGLVIGTGDLSELALGWCTYNGDQMSNYAVNAGVPKTLVRYIVETATEQKEFADAEVILKDILDTPISPELTGDGTLSQETEDIIGPYELHDFFIYNLLRWGNTRSTIEVLANRAFKDTYTPEEVGKWLDIFCKRFVTQQFKRNCMPDGVKVGRITLSPRGDFRFPSDAELAILLNS